jgi:putative hydrolase of the HAD superfamily
VADEVLLFDLGGVLVEHSVIHILRGLKPDVAEADLFDLWLDSEAVADFERGKIDENTFAQRFVEEWRVDVTPADFLAAFAAGVVGPYPGALDLLERLRGRYTLACLSNCNAAHWPLVEPVAARFDRAVVSHLCGMVKPDPEIFRLALEVLDRPASAVRFFDDALKNVRAAQAAGIKAHHTAGFDALQRTIAGLGLLEPA